jgi:hypothetical protein
MWHPKTPTKTTVITELTSIYIYMHELLIMYKIVKGGGVPYN